MGWSRNDSRQQTLALSRVMPEPSEFELQAAYERCVLDKAAMPFEQAMAIRSIALALKNAARAAILKRGGA